MILSYLNLVVPGSLNNKNLNLHKKAIPRRILVVIVHCKMTPSCKWPIFKPV